MLSSNKPYAIVMTLSLFASGGAMALDDSSYAVGKYWGQDTIEQTIEKENVRPPVKQQTKLAAAPTAVNVMESLTKMIDEAKAKAVLYPTTKNVRDFILLKNKSGDMATKFSQVWQQVLLENAALDYSAFKPTNNAAISELNKLRQSKISSKLKLSAKSMGLIYFYEGRDGLAKLQSQIINKVAHKHGFDILGVSLDGVYINSFVNNSIDNGQAKKMGVQKTPALFALSPTTGKYFPLSYTMLAEMELEQRMFDVLSHFEGHE